MNRWSVGIYTFLCMIAAMLLNAINPAWGTWQWLAPPWILVFLLFFTIYYPSFFNVGLAWIWGLLTDVWSGDPLGKNALMFVFSVFLIHFSFDGLTKMRLPGKLMLIATVLFLYRGISAFTATNFTLWHIWLPAALGGALSGTLIWFVLTARMEKLQV